MPRTRDQAICIRHLDWSETSQVVVLLTREHGKVRGLAKGSKRLTPSSVQRFSGGIELLTRGEVVMVLKHAAPGGAGGAELATLTEWDLQDDFHRLRADLTAQQLAMYAADLCNALLADHDPHPGSFEALRRLLEGLCNPGLATPQAALLRFQWAILDDTGYRPELWRDAVTGEELPLDPGTPGTPGVPGAPGTPGEANGALVFDPQAGGLTRQARFGAGDWRVRAATVAALRAVASGNDAEPHPGAGDAVTRANRLLCVYARTILDRELPTMRFVMASP